MKTIQIYDKPMCCSTGVCGTDVDPALPRFAADLAWLASQDTASSAITWLNNRRRLSRIPSSTSCCRLKERTSCRRSSSTVASSVRTAIRRATR